MQEGELRKGKGKGATKNEGHKKWLWPARSATSGACKAGIKMKERIRQRHSEVDGGKLKPTAP